MLLLLVAHLAVAAPAFTPMAVQDGDSLFDDADITWAVELNDARADFDLLLPQWIQAWDAIGLIGSQRESVESELLRRERALAEASAARSMESANTSRLRDQLEHARVEQLVATQALESGSKAELEQQAVLDEATARADSAAQRMGNALRRQGQDGKDAGRALERWWTLRKGMRWARAMSSGGTSSEALAHDEARRAFELASERVGVAVADDRAVLLEQADQEDSARWELMRVALGREINRASYASTNKEIARLEQQVHEADLRLTSAEERLAVAQVDLNDAMDAISGLEVHNEDLARLRRQIAALDERYGTLYHQLPAYGGPITAQQTCDLYMRSGLTSLMNGAWQASLKADAASKRVNRSIWADAVSHLHAAAVAHGAPCRPQMADLLHVNVFNAAWAEANLLAAQSEPGSVVVNVTAGHWSIDGTALAGTGTVVVRLLAGPHRFQFEIDGKRESMLADIWPGKRVLLQATDHGVLLVAYPLAPVVDGGGFLPTEPVPPNWLREHDDQQQAPDPRVRLSASGRWLRMNWLDDGTYDDLSGVSAEISWRLGPDLAGRRALSLGFAQDVAVGDETYRYTAGRESRAIFRERLTATLRWEDPKLRPALTLSAGVIPPANALVLEFGGGLSMPINDLATLDFGLGVGSTLWRGLPGSVDPSAQIGVARWF